MLLTVFRLSKTKKNVVGASGILTICIFCRAWQEAWGLREASGLLSSRWWHRPSRADRFGMSLSYAEPILFYSCFRKNDTKTSIYFSPWNVWKRRKPLSKPQLPIVDHTSIPYEAGTSSSEELQLAGVVPATPPHIQPSAFAIRKGKNSNVYATTAVIT